MLSDIQKHLEPATFVGTALTFDPDVYARSWGPFVLLVQIDDPNGQIVTALRRSVVGLPSAAVAPAHTVALHLSALDKGGPSGAGQRRWPESFAAAQARVRLIQKLHFAVPVRKRTRKEYVPGDKFLIGRGRDADLLLASEAVSKVHASLARTDDGQHFAITDGGSRNGTAVNGESIGPQKSVVLKSGDVFRVGNVEIMICQTEALWTALTQQA